MTTYKSKTYVKEQLESIFCQTRLPDEIVICDDASPDDTVEYLEKIVKSAPKEINIVIHKNIKNLGYQRNFEGCIKKCHGDVLFLCDADDVWDSQKIEKVMKRVTEYDKKRLVGQKMALKGRPVILFFNTFGGQKGHLSTC